VRQTSRHLSGRLAYTWSHAVDLDSGELTGVNLPPPIAAPQTNRGSADFDRRHALRALVSYEVPVLSARRWISWPLASWQFDVVGMMISGAPVTVTAAQDVANGSYILRADPIAGEPPWLDAPQTPTGRVINADAFGVPSMPGQGALGRNSLHASTLRQTDVALSRAFHLTSRLTLRCRVDVFNVFNTPNFAPPVGRLDGTPFGQPEQTYAEALGTGTLAHGGLVPLQQVGGPRSTQIGIRLRW